MATPANPTQRNLKNNSTASYSKAASSMLKPKRNCAIVFDAIEDLKIDDFFRAFKQRCDPKNLLVASKITQNRYVFYLKNEALVDELTQEGNNKLEIGNTVVYMRPYVAKLKRVIFSNVHPFIPDELIYDKLAEYDVTPKSSMSYLRVGTDLPEFQHVLCFRRQVFVLPEDIDKIPTRFEVNYEDITYNIYTTTDKMQCFICKKEGHTSKFCQMNRSSQMEEQSKNQKQQQTDSLNSGLAGINDTNLTTEILESQKLPSAARIELGEERMNPPSAPAAVTPTEQQLNFQGTPLFAKPTNNKENKRTRTALSASTDNSDIDPQHKDNTQTKKKQKLKSKLTPEIIDAELTMAKINVPNTTAATFPISFEQLNGLVKDTLLVPNTEYPEIITRYTENRQGLCEMLHKTKEWMTDRSMKIRITKIINTICSTDSVEKVSVGPYDEDTGDSDAAC